MSTFAFCLERRKSELPATLKVIRAIPDQKLDWKPEPKARTARELAWVLADEEEQLIQLIETGTIRWKETTPGASVEDIATHFVKHAEAVNERLAKVDEATWSKGGQMMVGDQAVWKDTVGNMVWGMLFDGIHHRGQLTTYLRPMGSKVPQVYGPTADEP